MSAQIIGLIAHPEKRGSAALVAALRQEFSARGASLRMETATAALIGERDGVGVAELGAGCDLLMVLGGDGTILRTVHALGAYLRPIFGINLGLLGFLTCLGSSDFRQAVDCVLSGSYRLSHRTLLEVDILRQGQPVVVSAPGETPQPHLGLNDAVISRGALSRLIQLETRIDGELLTQYNADGLIVATPTGSTAYSLSAGGPLLAPGSGVFAVTPICPHTLTNRSVIIEDHTCIEVRLRNQRDEVYLTVDGQRGVALQSEDTVRIRRAEQRLPLAMLPDLPFFELARRKLKWSGGSAGS